MASYQDIFNVSTDPNLVERLTIALAITCETIRSEDPATPDHDKRMALTQRVLKEPDNYARMVMLVALAQNKDKTGEQLMAVTDAALQAAVDSAVELLL